MSVFGLRFRSSLHFVRLYASVMTRQRTPETVRITAITETTLHSTFFLENASDFALMLCLHFTNAIVKSFRSLPVSRNRVGLSPN